MRRTKGTASNSIKRRQVKHRNRRHARLQARPPAAYRQRGIESSGHREAFSAPECWYEPLETDEIQFIAKPAGSGYVHPVGVEEVRARISLLPERFTQNLAVVQLSQMTRKQALFPYYGMQWGSSVYLYPLEESLVETYVRPPRPQQLIEAQMYGGTWSQDGELWRLTWTLQTIQDFYLNNVLIHEIGHVHDVRNSNFNARERYANWFAIEYGYRASRGRK
jgi:hypothetical protein